MVAVTERKGISIRMPTYLALKSCGQAGDSFDDVINKLLENRKEGDKARVGITGASSISRSRLYGGKRHG